MDCSNFLDMFNTKSIALPLQLHNSHYTSQATALRGLPIARAGVQDDILVPL